MPERFVIHLTPLPTAARVAKQRLAWKVHLAVSGVMLGVVLMVWVGPLHGMAAGVPAWGLPTLFILGAMGAAVRIGLTLWALARAKRDLAVIGDGAALYIDATGIEFVHPRPVAARWTDVSALKVAGSSLGAGPELILEVRGSVAAKIPLSFLDAMPAAIDSAVLARSMGRIRLDVSAMDKMI